MRFRIFLALLWAGVIFATSCTVIFRNQFLGAVNKAVPRVTTPQQLDSFWDRYWWVFVKGWHVIEYAILCLLILRLLPRRPHLAFALSVAYAATDEWHQTFVPRRGGRWTDVVIDAGGALAALLFASAVGTRRRALKAEDLAG